MYRAYVPFCLFGEAGRLSIHERENAAHGDGETIVPTDRDGRDAAFDQYCHTASDVERRADHSDGMDTGVVSHRHLDRALRVERRINQPVTGLVSHELGVTVSAEACVAEAGLGDAGPFHEEADFVFVGHA